MMKKKIRAHIWISGHVQGIGFRSWLKTKAWQLGLTGWVKNLADGRVEAVFEGEEEKAEAAVGACNKGPMLAYITDVEVKREKVEGLAGFEIRY